MLECGFHVKLYKMDFSSCVIMLGFGKSSHIYGLYHKHMAMLNAYLI